ncbi:MAG: amidohydrolase [Deltaproteobacteria bacterium]|nr:amidohydrolase [Deltaproteobacteria bacterium]
MNSKFSLMIDVYSHIMPPKYRKAMSEVSMKEPHLPRPALHDIEERFRVLDTYEGIVQVLTISLPTPEKIADSSKTVDLAKLANDEMAELVLKYPKRFVAAIACLPMNDMDAALKELDRAVNDLRFRGVQISTPLNGKPLDSPEFLPMYEKMHEYNLPIFIHPDREITQPDYEGEDLSKYYIYCLWGWPYETTVAMTRLVCSGVLEKFPGIKFITHHCGAMVPYFEERIIGFYDLFEMRAGLRLPLRKPPIDYFKMFYNDTALYGNTSALMCAYDFCGADHIVFGADMPLGDSQMGYRNYRQTIEAIDQMDISEDEKKMIFQGNARRLLRLPI